MTTTRTGGLVEIGELFGISKQRASQIAAKPDFPEPIARSRAGRTWDLDLVEQWGKTWDRSNKGGRPPKPKPSPADPDGP